MSNPPQKSSASPTAGAAGRTFRIFIPMIARLWHGKTSIENYDAYTDFLKEIAIPDYQKTPGFKGLSFLRRKLGDDGHFELITYWEDLDSIKCFAGEDYIKAKYYPEDDDFLLEFEPEVRHFDVFAQNI